MPTPLLILLLTVATYAQTPLHDKRDGKTYRTVKIGTQIWMAENLNYDAENSKCYENKPENCEKYVRLYDWETAMKSCPSSWHLPSNEEWKTLVNFAGGRNIAGKKLKAKKGWNEKGNGTDGFGFSALPGGSGYSDDKFSDVGNYGYWWSSSENDSDDAYFRDMNYNNEFAYWFSISKAGLFSVRCVKD